jgi:hypothetical protein
MKQQKKYMDNNMEYKVDKIENLENNELQITVQGNKYIFDDIKLDKEGIIPIENFRITKDLMKRWNFLC